MTTSKPVHKKPKKFIIINETKYAQEVAEFVYEKPGQTAVTNVIEYSAYQKAIEALKFYAHPEHYEERITLSGARQPGVLTEGGDKARATLKDLGVLDES